MSHRVGVSHIAMVSLSGHVIEQQKSIPLNSPAQYLSNDIKFIKIEVKPF